MTRKSPGMGCGAAFSQSTIGVPGIIAARPGIWLGSARRRATSARKSTKAGTMGTPAAFSVHCNTER